MIGSGLGHKAGLESVCRDPKSGGRDGGGDGRGAGWEVVERERDTGIVGASCGREDLKRA